MNSTISLTRDEFDFLFEAVARMHAMLVKEVQSNPRAARTPGASTIIGLFQRLSVIGNGEQVSTNFLSLSRHELRLMQRICQDTQKKLIEVVVPNYEERIGQDPELKEKYQPYIERAKKTVDNVITPVLEKIEGKL